MGSDSISSVNSQLPEMVDRLGTARLRDKAWMRPNLFVASRDIEMRFKTPRDCNFMQERAINEVFAINKAERSQFL